MHTQQVLYHRTARCTTIPPGDARQKFLLISAYLIGGAIIVLWLSYLPQLTGSLRDSFNIVPQHLTVHSVNHLHKADRLASGADASFDARWSGIATVKHGVGTRH